MTLELLMAKAEALEAGARELRLELARMERPGEGAGRMAAVPVVVEEDRAMSTAEAAVYLRRSERTLRSLRWRGGGPRYVQLGGRRGKVEYMKSDLDAYRRERLARNTNGARNAGTGTRGEACASQSPTSRGVRR